MNVSITRAKTVDRVKTVSTTTRATACKDLREIAVRLVGITLCFYFCLLPCLFFVVSFLFSSSLSVNACRLSLLLFVSLKRVLLNYIKMVTLFTVVSLLVVRALRYETFPRVHIIFTLSQLIKLISVLIFIERQR